MVRDIHRNKEHFLSYIKSRTESYEERARKLNQGEIKPDRIIPVKQNMAANLIHILVSKYSLGIPIDELVDDFNPILNLIEESWVHGSRKLIGPKHKVLNQYNIDAHVQLLTILSIGFLCVISKDFFIRLGKIINDDNVIDILFECILASKLNSWKMRQEDDDYTFKLYSNLKKAILQSEKEEAEKLVKIFLERDWIKEQKKAQMLTEPDKSWYHGAWSFESAAIVAILDLDDSSFRDNQYYPKDLVDYYRSTLKGSPC